MAGSAPNFNHRYIYLLRIFYGFFTRGEHNGPGHLILLKMLFEVSCEVLRNGRQHPMNQVNTVWHPMNQVNTILTRHKRGEPHSRPGTLESKTESFKHVTILSTIITTKQSKHFDWSKTVQVTNNPILDRNYAVGKTTEKKMSALIIRKYFPIGFLFDKIIRLL
jgi:hypothetical protein